MTRLIKTIIVLESLRSIFNDDKRFQISLEIAKSQLLKKCNQYLYQHQLFLFDKTFVILIIASTISGTRASI